MAFETVGDELTSMLGLAVPAHRILPDPNIAGMLGDDLPHFAFLYAEPTVVIIPPPPPPVVLVPIHQHQTRPPYPQPVLRHPVSGRSYYLQVKNDGTLDTPVMTGDEPTSIPRVTLVAGDRQTSWQLALSSDIPPQLSVIQRPLITGGFDDLSVWDWRGREYTLRIPESDGDVLLEPIGRDWNIMPSQGIPLSAPPLTRIAGQVGASWDWTVNDGGVWFLSTPADTQYHHLKTISLWTFDDTLPFTVSTTSDGILTVIDADPDTTPLRYEFALVSPDGIIWLLRGKNVNGDVILELSDELQKAVASADEWTIRLAQNGRSAYIVDDRFPPPLPGVPRRWGPRRRRTH